MRLKPKEKSKMDTRRKLWSLFDWHWAYKRNDGGKYKTEFTSDEKVSKGYGYFRKNHSVSCTDHAICRAARFIERQKRKKKLRRQDKEVIEEQLNDL